MKTITKIRKHFNDHRTYYAFCAGSIVTSTTIYYLQGGNCTLLKLTKDNAQMVKEGGAVVYTLKDQTLHLINIPAAEAAIAASV